MEKGNSTISIIIPFATNQELLIKTLKSVKDQSFTDWECIIINDTSNLEFNENLKYLLHNDRRLKFYNRPKNFNKGANSCRNLGFNLSKGEFIQWFDADDLMFPEMLDQKIKQIKKTNSDFIVCEGLICKGSENEIIGKWNQLESENPLLDHALGIINFQTNAPMFKRSFLDKKKLWNENLQRKQDYEFFSRLLLNNPKYDVIKKPLFYYRVHHISINGQNDPRFLSSMVKADSLVFQNIKKEAKYRARFHQIQKHFLRKNIGRLKIAFSSKKYILCIAILSNMLRIIDISYLKMYFLKMNNNLF